jgi:hypothetical protein
MPYFQKTALLYIKKILLLFQEVVNNKKKSSFRWLLKQIYLLFRKYNADNLTLFITNYNNTLINALKYKFP